MSSGLFGSQQQPPQPPQNVDLGKLFTDVSKTISGVRNFLSRPDAAAAAAAAAPSLTSTAAGASPAAGAAAANSPLLQSPLADAARVMSSATSSFASGSPLAGLLGGDSTCFQACGMDDIARAAQVKAASQLRTSIFSRSFQRAGELFVTMRYCAIVLTILAALAVFLLLVVVICLLYKHGAHWTVPHDAYGDESANKTMCNGRRNFSDAPIASLFQRRGHENGGGACGGGGEPKNYTPPPLPTH